MNWSRGMLRLWAVFGVIWILGCFAFFAEAGLMPPEAKSINVKVSELTVRRKQDRVWIVEHGSAKFEVEAPLDVTVGSPTWAKILEAVAKEVSQANAVENATERRRYEQTRNAFLGMASVPLLFLALGFVARWVIRGFRQI